MTVSSSASRNQYTATAGQTVFAYTFEIVSDDDIVVLKNGVTLTKTADYTVSGVGVDSGGNVTLTSGATAGDILTLYRDMPYDRTTDYTNAGDFLAADVNNDFDRLWIATQQVNEEVNRSIKAPVTDPLTIDMTIPAKADRLGKYLRFNSTTGNPEAGDVSGLYATAGLNVYNFTGDGSDTTFTLGIDPGTENNTQVYIDGVYQQKNTYNVSGKVITFSAAPPNLSTIEVMVVEPQAVGNTTASSVSFTQAGSSTERTVQLKLQESVSVKDFGAVGDGVTDDTAAIQAAVNHGITNSAEVHWPDGVYLCGALTVPSSGKLIWRSDSAEIKETGTDITLISPTGNVDVEGLKFTDYTVGFNFNSISANAQIRFHNISVENCGTIDVGGGRVDFNGFVTCGTSANTIISFRLTDSYFSGDDFGIAYRGPFKSFVVEGSDFNGFKRMAIMVGDNSGNQDEYRKVQISNNTIRTVVSDDSSEYEIKGILVYGYQVNIIGNIVDTVRDIHASTHDSEAIYVKGVMYNITDNIVVDGGRGDGYITVKGNVLDGDPDSIVDGTAYSKHGNISNNQVYASSAFTTSYGKISGIYIDGTRANIATNQVLGFWDTGIFSSCTSIINDNQIKGEFTDGIRVTIDDGIFSDATFTRVNGNHIEAEGATSTMVKFILTGGSGHEIQNVEITNNSMFTTSTMTATGNEAFVLLQLDKNATASNTIRNAQVSNNIFHGTSGEQLNCLVIFTTNGSGANNGKVEYIDFSDNVAYTVANVFRIAGGSGDVNAATMTGGNYQSVNNRLLSNPTFATTFVCKNVKSNRYTEIAGTITLASGTTSKTVTMGMQDTLRPVDLENIQVMPIEDLGSASYFYVDTLSGDNFNINVDANPGKDVDFAYVVRNRYFY